MERRNSMPTLIHDEIEIEQRRLTYFMKIILSIWVMLAGVVSLHAGTRTVDLSTLPKGVERVDVYLLMGQSNMKGRGKVPKKQKIHPRIVHMNMVDEQWYGAKHPLHKAGVPDLIDGKDNAGVGPGLDFARELVANDDKVLVALVPCARGGSWIDLWGANGREYNKALPRAQKALSDFPEGTARIAGVLWLQGESDAVENRYGAYADKLTDLVQRLRIDLNEPQLPLVACTIGTFIKPKGKYLYVREINNDLLNLPKQVPNTACVDARDLDGHIGDFMHYNTRSQQSIGRRFAKAYLDLIGAGTDD